MRRYYYLAASLGDLELETKPALELSEFLEELSIYLSAKDMRCVSVLRELIDIENIRRLLLEQKLDPRGNLSEKELDEAVLGKVDLPDYVLNFLDAFTTNQSKLEHFSALFAGYFEKHVKTGSLFLDQYLQFERELRLWISILRAQRLGLDFNHVLQFEEAKDPLVMSMLVQAGSLELRLPEPFNVVKDIYITCLDNPALLHKKIELFRLSKIDELIQDRWFQGDSILGFLAKLFIIEEWQSLSPSLGLEYLNRFTKKH